MEKRSIFIFKRKKLGARNVLLVLGNFICGIFGYKKVLCLESKKQGAFGISLSKKQGAF